MNPRWFFIQFLTFLNFRLATVRYTSYDCTNCNNSVQCNTFCTTQTTPLLKTKPPGWRLLPCTQCFGWVKKKNATIKLFCQYGCGTRRTPFPPFVKVTTRKATTKLATIMLSTVDPMTKENGFSKQKEKLLVFNEDDNTQLHLQYIWLLIGVVACGLLGTSLLVVVRRVTNSNRRVGVLRKGSTGVVVRIGEPFTVA